jgi:hypothetical protein
MDWEIILKNRLIEKQTTSSMIYKYIFNILKGKKAFKKISIRLFVIEKEQPIKMNFYFWG